MDMRHPRFTPALVAAAVGTILCAAYMQAFGFDADIGRSMAALAATAAVMVGPGVAAVAFYTWRGDPDPRSHHQAAQIVSIIASAYGEAIVTGPAHARAHTPPRGERRLRDRRVAARIAQTLPIAWS